MAASASLARASGRFREVRRIYQYDGVAVDGLLFAGRLNLALTQNGNRPCILPLESPEKTGTGRASSSRPGPSEAVG